jgi:hypothetical protein
MQVFIVGAIALVVGAVLVLIAVFSKDLGHKTCRECGGRLPRRLSKPTDTSAHDDWPCPKCGTLFDRQGRARNQLST